MMELFPLVNGLMPTEQDHTQELFQATTVRLKKIFEKLILIYPELCFHFDDDRCNIMILSQT